MLIEFYKAKNCSVVVALYGAAIFVVLTPIAFAYENYLYQHAVRVDAVVVSLVPSASAPDYHEATIHYIDQTGVMRTAIKKYDGFGAHASVFRCAE